MLTLRLVLLGSACLAVLAAGCECGRSHELPGNDASIVHELPPAPDAAIDAGMDAGRAMDAARDASEASGRFFTLEPAMYVGLADDRCAATEGGTAMIAARISLASTCETPGPTFADVDHAARTITLEPRVWLEHGRTDCAPSMVDHLRFVPVPDLTAGAWTIIGTTSSLPLVVDAPSPAACSGLVPIAEGGTCFADCDCERGLSCIAIRGDAACEARCQDPCEREGASLPELGLGCADGRECGSDPNVGDVCRERADDGCDDTTCPAGMTCTAAPRHCEWTVELNGATRHECTVNGDCEAPGLECVHHEGGVGRCEVRCTTSDMGCPTNAPHACDERGICEWLGE